MLQMKISRISSSTRTKVHRSIVKLAQQLASRNGTLLPDATFDGTYCVVHPLLSDLGAKPDYKMVDLSFRGAIECA